MANRALLLFVVAILVSTAGTALPRQEVGSATVPLKDLLKMHEAGTAETKDEDPSPPPIPYSVDEIDIHSRIVGAAIDATATIKVSVLTDDWVQVPLFRVDSDMEVTKLPKLDQGNLVMVDQTLALVTQSPGSFTFNIGLLKRARVVDGLWTLRLRPGEATVRRLHVTHDEGSFRVVSDDLTREGDELLVFPRNGQFSLQWNVLQGPTTAAPQTASQRPPTDPIVKSAVTSVVVTLDGQRIARHRYDLRFESVETIAIEIPAAQTVSKVFLNGVSIPAASDATTLTVPVSPPRPGEESAILELVLREDMDPLSLSGTLSFDLPIPSWSVHDLHATFHLPSVFNYEWRGGSLSPSKTVSEVSFTHSIPTPGKTVTLHQQLVNRAPDAQLNYTVDLTDKYYR